MRATKLVLFPLLVGLWQGVTAQNIIIKVDRYETINPIDGEIVTASISLLNQVFNSQAFKDSLSAYSFFCSNKESLCNTASDLKGVSVFEDFINRDTININLKVKKLWNPFRRYLYGTMGITNPNGNNIHTYTWWLKGKTKNALITDYAAHVGHEIFHTKYLKYYHNPRTGSREFVEEKDATYTVGNLLEKLIRAQLAVSDGSAYQ